MEKRFGRTSPVLRYWLAHSEGFAVSGGAKGIVAELVRDGDPHVPIALVVHRRRRRARTIDADAIVAVLPDRRTFVVEKKRRERPSLPKLPELPPLPELPSLRSLPPLPKLPPVDVRPLLRSLQWLRSALSVRFAMTRVSPERLQISWRRPTTSSRPTSAPDTSRAAHTTSST